MDDMHFGMCLRSVREERGLTQDQLAALVQAGNKKHICDYERGRTDPHLSTVRRFAQALGVPVARLVEEER
jgi:transcriptional regulator with XRE-family HTH domain